MQYIPMTHIQCCPHSIEYASTLVTASHTHTHKRTRTYTHAKTLTRTHDLPHPPTHPPHQLPFASGQRSASQPASVLDFASLGPGAPAAGCNGARSELDCCSRGGGWDCCKRGGGLLNGGVGAAAAVVAAAAAAAAAAVVCDVAVRDMSCWLWLKPNNWSVSVSVWCTRLNRTPAGSHAKSKHELPSVFDVCCVSLKASMCLAHSRSLLGGLVMEHGVSQEHFETNHIKGQVAISLGKEC